MKTITLNGKPHPLLTPLTILELLNKLGLNGKPVIAELNEIAILPRLYADTTLHHGDTLELVTLAAGG